MLLKRQDGRQRLQITAEAAGYWVGRPSSGRQRSTRTTDNLDLVHEVVLHKNG